MRTENKKTKNWKRKYKWKEKWNEEGKKRKKKENVLECKIKENEEREKNNRQDEGKR